jgi:hypothetical protein
MRPVTKTITEGRNDNENAEGRVSDEDIENEEEETESDEDMENEEEGPQENDDMDNEEEGNDDTTALTFVIEHLVPAILGRRTWKRHM